MQNSYPSNFNAYSHYVFNTLDQDDTGFITFEDFVLGLSILVKGCLEDKLRWIFSLYDQDRDGYISRGEMEEVVASVFDLNGDGYVAMEEFLRVCMEDDDCSQSISAFSN